MIRCSFERIARRFAELVALTLCLSIALLIALHVTAIAQAVDHPVTVQDDELKELELYRQSVPKLANDIQVCEQKLREADVTENAYNTYISTFYRQASEFRDQRLKLYEWQLFASNGVLAVVLIMSIGGFIITTLQIYQLYKLNALNNDTKFEVSIQHIRLTTSITGIVVLVISFMFLVVFLQEVYRIHPAAGSQILSSESRR